MLGCVFIVFYWFYCINGSVKFFQHLSLSANCKNVMITLEIIIFTILQPGRSVAAVDVHAECRIYKRIKEVEHEKCFLIMVSACLSSAYTTGSTV